MVGVNGHLKVVFVHHLVVEQGTAISLGEAHIPSIFGLFHCSQKLHVSNNSFLDVVWLV